MFRYDLKFDKLITYLENKYKNISKIKVIMHACSDGEEVYSFLSKLVDSLGYDKSKKYLPISANDIDSTHINLAQQGKYKIEEYERKNLEYNLKENLIKYFNKFKTDCSPNIIEAKDELKRLVNFKISNILDDVKNLKLSNTVLFARNMWPYLSDEEADKLAMYLSNNMDNTSTLIIGDFDKTYSIDSLLRRYGFKESLNISNVFYKEAKTEAPVPPAYYVKIKKLISKIKAGF